MTEPTPSTDFSRNVSRRAVLGSLFALLAIPGCGYVVGAPYSPEIRTVHIPTFSSTSFRRGWEQELTEYVQKEVQNRTPFRLAKEPFADTRLTGRIVDTKKSVLGENQYDDPRQLQVSLAVEVTWQDLRSKQILAQGMIPLNAETINVVNQAEFAPEVGQSLATAKNSLFKKLSADIVDMMEEPW